MKREELVIKKWNEVETYQGLKRWHPPDGCRHRPRMGHYSRLQAIEILEDALTRRRGKGIDISCEDSLADTLETELTQFYVDLDGTFDHLPFLYSSAPKIAQNLMPEMLMEELKNWNPDSPIMIAGLNDSIMHDYLCDLTGLKPEQLILGNKSACLVIRDVAADTEQIFPFDLPAWLVDVNELALLDWRQNGLMNVRQLRENLVCEIRNCTCKTGTNLTWGGKSSSPSSLKGD